MWCFCTLELKCSPCVTHLLLWQLIYAGSAFTLRPSVKMKYLLQNTSSKKKKTYEKHQTQILASRLICLTRGNQPQSTEWNFEATSWSSYLEQQLGVTAHRHCDRQPLDWSGSECERVAWPSQQGIALQMRFWAKWNVVEVVSCDPPVERINHSDSSAITLAFPQLLSCGLNEPWKLICVQTMCISCFSIYLISAFTQALNSFYFLLENI